MFASFPSQNGAIDAELPASAVDPVLDTPYLIGSGSAVGSGSSRTGHPAHEASGVLPPQNRKTAVRFGKRIFRHLQSAGV